MSIIIIPHRPYYVGLTTYVDAVYCYRPSSVVCRSVCWSVTLVSPAKTVESIEMTFGVRTQVDPGNHVLDGAGVQIPMGRGNFGGKGQPILKYRDTVRSPVRKRLNRSLCRLDCGLRMAQGIMS